MAEHEEPWKKFKASSARMIGAAEICFDLATSYATAYKIIRQGNDDLKARGYFTVTGKLPRAYYNEKFYGGNKNDRG